MASSLQDLLSVSQKKTGKACAKKHIESLGSTCRMGHLIALIS